MDGTPGVVSCREGTAVLAGFRFCSRQCRAVRRRAVRCFDVPNQGRSSAPHHFPLSPRGPWRGERQEGPRVPLPQPAVPSREVPNREVPNRAMPSRAVPRRPQPEAQQRPRHRSLPPWGVPRRGR